MRERHRAAGKKPHPRDGLIAYTGFYEAHTGKVYVLGRRINRFVPAARHPKVFAGKEAHARQVLVRKRELKQFGLQALSNK